MANSTQDKAVAGLARKAPRAQANPLDHLLRAWLAHATNGLSPAALELAFLDWILHYLSSPGEHMDLMQDATEKATRLQLHALNCGLREDPEPCVKPAPNDRRFRAEGWERWPFNWISQSFLLQEQWWERATREVRGVSPHHRNMVNFVGRQLLDMMSPSNGLFTNPELIERTVRQGGANLWRGAENFIDDVHRRLLGEPPAGTEGYTVGENLAVTPGKVVLRNELMELIQYSPTTKTVHPEPILLVPAWIMKYYILDLSKDNSLVRYLVERGYTVFAISWKNPDADDRQLSMADYLRVGVAEAIDAVSAITGGNRIHAVGYCLGGTLLTLAAAGMGRSDDERLASVTLFAAQVDFTEPGELGLFIDESQVTYLEDLMWEQGYLDARRMAGAFQWLRSQDLVWSRVVHDYLMGERESLSDLMAWNADTTRMPYRMHSEYLRRLYLDNDFAQGRFQVAGQPVHPGDIRAPVFAVGTERDHVAPWTSVYKITRLARVPVHFLLTSGGHNVGVVNPPGHPHRHYRLHLFDPHDMVVPPGRFLSEVAETEGSWWPAWEAWLRERSGEPVPAPAEAGGEGYPALYDAPGEYVRQP